MWKDSWSIIGNNGTNSSVNTITGNNSGTIYIGGNFTYVSSSAGGATVYVSNLLRHSGDAYTSTNQYNTIITDDGRCGFNNTVTSLYGLNNNLYIGGEFTQWGTILNGNPNPSPTQANYICQMDTTTRICTQLSSGLNGFCNAITLYKSTLYLGGQFTTDNTSNSINRICYIDNNASIFYNSTVLTILNETIQKFEEIETTTVSGLTGAATSQKYLTLLGSGKKYVF
jgi:hypothetical protein